MTEAAPSTQSLWTGRRVVLATLVVVAVAACFWLIYRFWHVAFILFVAIVLGTAIRPAVDWLHRRRLPRPAGVVLVYLLILALLVGFVLLLVPMIVEQVSAISNKLPGYYEGFRQLLLESSSRLLRQLGAQLPPEIFAPAPGPAPSEGQEGLGLVSQAFGYAELIFKVLFTTIAVLLLGFYWTLDGERIVRSLSIMLPMERRKEIRELVGVIELKVGGYVRGQALLNLVIGVMSLVAYLLIGLPYALVLALIAAVMETIPIIGPVLGGLPALLLAITTDPSKVVWVVVATVIIQQLENNLLVPRIMDKSVGVNPIVTLLSLAAFGSLLGVPGALLAIPLAAVFQILIDRFVLRIGALEQPLPTGRDRLSILRYEAQRLAHDVRKQVRRKEDPLDAQIDRIEDTIEAVASEIDRGLAQAAVEQVSP